MPRSSRLVAMFLATVLASPTMALAAEPPAEGSRVRLKATGTVSEDGTVRRDEKADWIVGRVLRLDDELIEVAPENGSENVRVLRASVSRLDVSRGRSRSRGALLGAAAGVAVGIGLAAWVCDTEPGEGCGWYYAIMPAVVAPVTSLLGAAVGKEQWTSPAPARFRIGVAPARGGVRVGCSVRF